jgi:hypothetical protein
MILKVIDTLKSFSRTLACRNGRAGRDPESHACRTGREAIRDMIVIFSSHKVGSKNNKTVFIPRSSAKR